MYKFFLGDIQFPVTPSKLGITYNNQNQTISLMNDDEVNILKQGKLIDYEFEFMLPHTQYPFVSVQDLKTPIYYQSMLANYKDNKLVLDFVINRTMPNGDILYDTSIKVSIEDLSFSEDAENGFDLLGSITLKQYRAFGTKVLNTFTDESGKTAVTEEKQRPITKLSDVPKTEDNTFDFNANNASKTYTVKAGDTLSGICKKELGDGSKAMYTKIAKLNNISDPNFITVGTVIKFS